MCSSLEKIKISLNINAVVDTAFFYFIELKDRRESHHSIEKDLYHLTKRIYSSGFSQNLYDRLTTLFLQTSMNL